MLKRSILGPVSVCVQKLEGQEAAPLGASGHAHGQDGGVFSEGVDAICGGANCRKAMTGVRPTRFYNDLDSRRTDDSSHFSRDFFISEAAEREQSIVYQALTQHPLFLL